jgi:preprotein translocase subunit SecD
MNENQHSEDEILSGLRRRLSGAEPLIPQPPTWEGASTGKDGARARVVVRSRVGVGSFAALTLVAAVVVVAVGLGLGGRASSGSGPAGSPGNGSSGSPANGSVFVSYQLIHPAGTQVTSAELDATKAVLIKRAASLGATSYSVNEAPPDGITVTVEGVADTTNVRAMLGQTGRLEFVLLPPETYGTAETPGTKPVPSSGDSIDPSLPAQFTGADLDLGAISAAVDTNTGGSAWLVGFAFKDAAAGQFETWSGLHVNDFFAIVLDGKVLSAPYIKSQITGGKGQIGGDFTAEQARGLATVLQSGWLPFPLSEVSAQVDPGAQPSVIPPSGAPIPEQSTPASPTVVPIYVSPAPNISPTAARSPTQVVSAAP